MREGGRTGRLSKARAGASASANVDTRGSLLLFCVSALRNKNLVHLIVLVVKLDRRASELEQLAEKCRLAYPDNRQNQTV